MAEDKREDYTFGPQPYQPGQDVPPAPPAPEVRDEPAASTDIDHGTPAVSPGQQQRADAVAGSDRQIKTIKDWMEAEENRPETAEERDKRERMEKSKKIIAAFSDGISALSNLYFTSQYAPNMYNHEKGSMTDAVDARIERLKAEREKKRDRYLNFSLKLGDIENDRAKTLRELEAQQERQKLAREKAQREAEQHGWLSLLQPDKQREQAGKANKAEQEARVAQAEADNAPALQQAKLATEKARGEAQRASAANSRASAAAHGRSQVVHHFNGKAYPKGSNDYEKDVREEARRYNERHGKWVDEADGSGQMKRKWVYDEGFQPIITDRKERTAHGERTVPRKAEEYAGEVETAIAKEREDNTPPSRRSNNNDNTPPSRR